MLAVNNCDLLGKPMQPKKSSFASLSNEALCKLRDEIVALLNSRAEKLRMELDRLTNGSAAMAGKVTETPKKKDCPKIPRATWRNMGWARDEAAMADQCNEGRKESRRFQNRQITFSRCKDARSQRACVN